MTYNSQLTIDRSFSKDSNEITQATESEAPNSKTEYFLIYH